MQRILSRGLLLVAAALLAGSVSMGAQGAKSVNKTVRLISGKASTVELAGAVSDVLVANPAIADVGTLRSNRLYIVGRAVGDTNILAYDEAGNPLADISVHVRIDDKSLQDALREFFPDERITARTVKNDIVLGGTVSSPAVSSQVRDLATRFMLDPNQKIVDLMTVKGEQQVMLKVKVIEAKRNVLKELGFEPNFKTTGTDGFIFDGGDVGRTQTLPFGTGTLLLGKKGAFGPLSATLRALETNGAINTLAEPNLTAISGETAGFLAGGEYPVPTGRDSQGNIILEFKQFGVSLNFTPTVLSKDRIGLHMSTEVSEKDPSTRVVLADVQVEGLSVRRAETTVEVGSGGTIMIAGLIKSTTLHTLNGYPGANELPILGRLFQSDSFKRDESELIIIVSPFLVEAYAEPEAVAETDMPVPAPIQFPEPPLKQPKIPEKKGESAAAVPVEPVERVRETSTVLSQRFVDNLKKVYGDRLPEKVGAGESFGYIID